MIKILIADDNLIARLLLSEQLSGYGACDAVVDGIEAVRAYRLALQRDKPYDLICLDIMMPNMDGIEALCKIRDIEKEHDVPYEKQVTIIMVTALHDEITKNTAQDAKCSAYLTKPIDHKELTSKLTDLKLI